MASPGGDFFSDPSRFPNPLALFSGERGNFENSVFPLALRRVWMGIIGTGEW